LGSVAVLCLVLAGCAGSNDADVVDPLKTDISGTWSYLATNGHEATFVGCSGDATILEGLTFAGAMSQVSICIVPGSMQVVQSGETFAVLPRSVTCSDGSEAMLSGEGVFSGATVVGEWNSVSDGEVVSTQVYSGSTSGETISILESTRVFSGSFAGACDLSPPLAATLSF
jgi:hypothetical protein